MLAPSLAMFLTQMCVIGGIGGVNFFDSNLRHQESEESIFGDNNDLKRAVPALFLTTWDKPDGPAGF